MKKHAMTYYPDISEHTMVAAGPHVRAIGWLDDKHDFPTGSVPTEFVSKLRRITESDTFLFLYYNELDFFLSQFYGFHTCELCHNFNGGNNIVVPADKELYVAPSMILHYVEEHRYLPPKQFVNAVLESPIPGTKDYANAVAKYRELHKRYLQRKDQERFEEASRLANKRRSPIIDCILSEKKKQ